MRIIQFIKKNVIYILLFIGVFSVLFNQFKTYAVINFDFIVLNSKISHIDGQIYYAKDGAYNGSNMTPFMLRHNEFNITKKITVPLYNKDIHFVRFDPLDNVGEVLIHNFNIIQGYGFNQKVRSINFMDINFSNSHNIKVLQRNKNFVHLRTTGLDPYVQLITDLNISPLTINYHQILIIAFLSLLLVLLIYIIASGIQSGYLRGEEIMTASIILLYSLYTFLYANQFYFSEVLLLSIPIIGIFIVYRQGIVNYVPYLKKMIIMLLVLTIIVYISNYFNHIETSLSYFILLLKLIIPAMLTSMLFIQKKSFNLHFYKKFLLIFTLFLAATAIGLHHDLIQIDTIITFGYKMSMSAWSQKNYTFWYLILMWSTISFFHFSSNNKKESLIILIILTTSFIAIMSGYSDSAKLAFWVSLGIYILLININFSIKLLLIIPVIISLYLLCIPWISDFYVYLAGIHPRLEDRHAIFTIFPEMIKHHLLFGYGFGNVPNLIPSDYISQETITKFSSSPWLKRCVPHSVFLFAWLNLGLVGVSFLSIVIYKAIKSFVYITYQKNSQPALFALIVTFLIIFTFSWGNLMAYAILTYSFLIGMIFLSLNQNSEDV